MGYFNYHIGTHLFRPSAVSTNTSYTPDSTTSPIALTTNSEDAILTAPFTGQSIHDNFYYLAVSATDNTHRIAALEAYSNDSGSTNFGFVNYNGKDEYQGRFYGGSPLSLTGTIPITCSATTAYSFPQTLVFRIAAFQDIVYYPSGSINSSTTTYREITMASGGSYSSPTAIITYFRTKLVNNSKTTGLFKVDGTTGVPTLAGTWASTFGAIGPSNPKSFYIFWNGGYTPFDNGEDIANVNGAKITFTSPPSAMTPAAVVTYFQNALNTAAPGVFTVSAESGDYIHISASSDRDSTTGICQFTILKDSVGDSATTPTNWGVLDNSSGGLGLYDSSNTIFHAWDFNSLVELEAIGTGPYTFNITGISASAPITFLDKISAGSGYGFFNDTAGFGMRYNSSVISDSAAILFPHTRVPPSSYSQILNYGGAFWASSLGTKGSLYVEGDIICSGTINQTALQTGFSTNNVLPSYIEDSSFEYYNETGSQPYGWSTYANSVAAATPETGIGGNPNVLVTFKVNSSSPLFGVYDGLFTKDAANRQGTGISVPFTTDRGASGQPFQVVFYYNTSSSYVSGDISAFVYDVTNGTLIPLSVSAVPYSSSAGMFLATFYPSTSNSYRFILHIASTNANAWTFEMDNIAVSPQSFNLIGASAISGWQQYSLTIGGVSVAPGKSGTITSDYALWRRVGSDMEIMYNLVQTAAGTTGTGNYLYPLPSGYSIDVSRIGASNSTLGFTLGICHLVTASVQIEGHVEVVPNTSTTALLLEVPTVVSNGLRDTDAFQSSSLYPLSTITEVHFLAKVPISQWTAQTNLASDFTEYVYNTTTTDADDTSGFGTGKEGIAFPVSLSTNRSKRVRFTKPILATDKIEIEAYDKVTLAWYPITQTRYGSLAQTIQNAVLYGVTLRSVTGSQTDLDVYFGQYARSTGASWAAAGEVWTNYNTASNDITKWRVRKTSNGNMAEYPTLIRAEYYISTGATFDASTSQINFATKVEDTNNAVTSGASWKFIVPLTGLYKVSFFAQSATGQYNAGDYFFIEVFKNGTVNRRLCNFLAYTAISTVTPMVFTGNTELRLSAGDYIDLRNTYSLNNGSKPTAWAASYPRVGITRIGN